VDLEYAGLPSPADRVKLLTRIHRPAPMPISGRVPTVSVVVPCFNYEHFLPASVGSALSQPGVAIDVIVVDDCSTDSSLAVARSLAEADQRVRVLEHRRNQGPVATFNDGLELAQGEYVIRLDADDLLTPGSVGRAAALLERFPGVGMVYGHPLHFVGDDLPPASSDVASWTVWPGSDWLRRRCELGVNCITSPEVVMRSSVVDVVGGQRELAHTHDMEMWMRLASVADVGHVDGADQAWHRDHDRSRSAVGVDVLTDLAERRDAFELLLREPVVPIADAADLLDLSQRALAREALDRACRAYDRNALGDRPVAEFVEFAQSVYPRSQELSEWRALQRRIRVGPALASKMPWFLASAVRRKLEVSRAYRTWERTGI